MLARLRKRLTYANVMSTVAAFAALGGGAYAAVSSIPGPDGRISGCYVKKTGNLRVIKSGGKCRKGERKLVWSQTGPPGVPGQNGANGQNGENGQNGAPGTARAYARVGIDSFDPTKAAVGEGKGIATANVVRQSEGIFCFGGLGFTPENIVATAAYTGPAHLMVQTPATTTCPEGFRQAEVQVTDVDGATRRDRQFYVLLN